MQTRLRLLPAAALLLASAQTAAICPINGLTRYVGNTATDASCTDNDIQSAINNASPTCSTTIVITQEHTWTGLALDLHDKSITLRGASTSCNPFVVCDPAIGCSGGGSTLPTLQGNGSASVLNIHGNSNVALQKLTLQGGGGTYGGGVHFAGTGSLSLSDTSIVNNRAAYGGGIQFNGSGGNATLILNPGSLILENTSGNDGGGIHVNGSARLFALAPSTLIGYNHAPNGYGGGIVVVGPALADIASPGYNGGAVLQYNDAQNGGAIAVFATMNNPGTVRVFTIDAQNPVQVANNTATNLGGAIYIKGNGDGNGAFAYACLFDYRVNNNIAADGAAIYADYHLGSNFAAGSTAELNGSQNCGPESPPALGAVPCVAGAPCNQMTGNATRNANNQPTAGAVIAIGQDSSLDANRLDMRGNVAGTLIGLVNGYIADHVSLITCLLADNHTQHELVSLQANFSGLTIDGCTMANNTIDNGYVVFAGTPFNNPPTYNITLTDSIIDQPGNSTLDWQGNASHVNVSYVMATEIDSIPVVSPTIIQASPTFVDPANGDYHLKAASWGIDFALAKGGTDLDRLPRDIDLVQAPNKWGPRDLGAYERQYACAADTVFCDGFDAYQ